MADHPEFPFTQKLADEICERLIEGESLRSICKAKHMPSAALVCRWQADHPAFGEQYMRARDAQADTLADEILEIADKNGLPSDDKRVRIDTRKWLAGKLKPKKWGDKTILSGDPESPLQVNQTLDPSKLSDEALAELMNARAKADE